MRRVVYGSEQQLVEQLARYMQFAHPDVLYRFDLAADLKLTVGQAARHKRLHPHRGWPDLFVAAPRVDLQITDFLPDRYGLFIELKREGTRIKKRNGEWASDHIAEQAAIHEHLRAAGYAAAFACGLDEAISHIDKYLGTASDEQVSF